jgi:hypothetical protein
LVVFGLLVGLGLVAPGRRLAYVAHLAGAGLVAWGLWLLYGAWFGGPEGLRSLGEYDRRMLADHDDQIEHLRQLVLRQRPAPQTAVEAHNEYADLERLVLQGARNDGADPTLPEAGLKLLNLKAQRRPVAELWKEKVARAREHDRILGDGVVGVGLALLVWAGRRVPKGTPTPKEGQKTGG